MAGTTGGVYTGTGGVYTTGGVITGTGGVITATGGVITATGGIITATGGIITATGGIVTATGGIVTATGGVVTATGGTTGTVTDPDVNNGFISTGTWTGYCYTAAAATSTITPVCDAAGTAACFTASGASLCASGSVAAQTDYGGYAQVGCNLNQDATGATVGTWAVTGTGVTANVSNTGGSPIRIQCQTADATPTRWCVTIVAGQTQYPWSSFNTACWDNSGTVPLAAGTLLKDCGIIVPGTNTTAVAFNFCIADLDVY